MGDQQGGGCLFKPDTLKLDHESITQRFIQGLKRLVQE